MKEAQLRRRAEAFAAETPDAGSRDQVRTWLNMNRLGALRDAFQDSLTFGTAGLRAPMGVGTGRMNTVSVRRAVTALCQYMQHLQTPDLADPDLSLCVGFDGRHGSAAFAREAVGTARALGFRVRAFEQPVPTPVLAFATKQCRAAAGLMITASHNPPADNGIKVFWRGGRQVLSPHDTAIATRLRQLDDGPVGSASDAAAGLKELGGLGDSEIEAYLSALLAVVPEPPAGVRRPSVTYSAMCGVGTEVTRRVLCALGVTELHEVEQECRVDPDFAGLASPNPESPAALVRARALAESAGSDLLLAHDPDADRLAVMVRHHGSLARLTGDDVGALLSDYRLSQHRGKQPAVVTTAVSSELLGRIAASHGALHARTPTGLKWVCQRGRAFEEQQGATYLFGYEEALGYCLPELGDDKDGVAALALVVALCVQLAEHDRTLVDALHALYLAHGVHRTGQVVWEFSEEAQRTRVLAALRDAPPTELAGRPLSPTSPDRQTAALVTLCYADDLRLVVRPSGTEPKLKAYLEVRTAAPAPDALERTIKGADEALARARNELRLAAERLGQG